MIRAFRFIWEQLNGPQVTGVTQSLFEYMRSSFDKWLDYWYTLSNTTANEAHLETFGMLKGIARPNVLMKDENYFVYSTLPEGYYEDDPVQHESGHGIEHGSEAGFDSLVPDNKPVGLGGKFYLSVNVKGSIMPLPAGYYRMLMKGAFTCRGTRNSLDLLDSIMAALADHDALHRKVDNPYKFVILPEGDIDIYVHGQSTWSNPPALNGSIEACNKTLFGPRPVLNLIYDF